MKIFKISAILFTVALLINSCGKDPVDPATTPDDNKISTTAATNKCDYSPYSPGTTFTFEYATKDFLSEKWSYSEYRGSVTEYRDLNGKKYSVGKGFFAQDTSSASRNTEGFIRCDGTGMFALAKGINNGKDAELPLLQYPLTKGKTWSSAAFTIAQNGATGTNQYKYKVVNVGLTKKVKNNTFKDVIEIEETVVFKTTVPFPIENEYKYTRFFDKQVGLIETIFLFEDPFTGDSDTTAIQRLVSFSIK